MRIETKGGELENRGLQNCYKGANEGSRADPSLYLGSDFNAQFSCRTYSLIALINKRAPAVSMIA